MRLSLFTLALGASSVLAGPSGHESRSAPLTERRVNRLPDSDWDHVVKGADVAGERASATLEGPAVSPLANFNLRVKEIDPSSLGVDTVKQYSGYLDNDETDKHLFYWFFESRSDPSVDPVILWLNGGPGCSSLYGLFQELGPAKILPDQTIEHNPHSWNNNASVIFIDQPVNVGFSYSNSNSTGSTLAASDDLYALLTLFFTEFPEYATQDFHVAGESYAGHYVPGVGHKILSEPDSIINLKSLLVGNGLTDPLTQYAYYRPMACGEGGYPAVLGDDVCSAMDEDLPACQSLIEQCYAGELQPCRDAFDECNRAFFNPYINAGLDTYDVREGHVSPESGADQWLNSQEVMDALGVEVQGYEQCDDDVYSRFEESGDWMQPIHRFVPDILAKVPVLVYAGDADYICNWLGNQAWTKALDWPGKEAFNAADEEPLRAAADDSRDYGKIWTAENFAFVQVFEAGHMVPTDQPIGSLDMVNRWVGGEWWTT